MSVLSGLSGLDHTTPAPGLLAVCCVCGHVRDEFRPPSDPMRWTTQSSYRKASGRNPAECPLTHTYCPECFRQAQAAARTYFQGIGV